jgi:hypothetical protein
MRFYFCVPFGLSRLFFRKETFAENEMWLFLHRLGRSFVNHILQLVEIKRDSSLIL